MGRDGNMKILIVDDEMYERVLIEKCVDWEEKGFTIVGSVQSAEEALGIFEQERPDIIFTDISMPFMDGLELSQKIRQQDARAKIVIVTGYRDFEYARKAIKIGVEDFLLKPIEADELEETALKVRQDILKEREGLNRLAAGNLSRDSQSGFGQEEIVQDGSGHLNQKALRYIEEHLFVNGLSLNMIASDLYVNNSYLSRIFKQSMGESITKYIMRRRIEKSMELFDTTDLKVYEVAERVGMPDAHYFGTCFKKHTGTTVNEYKSKKHTLFRKKREL